MDEEKQIKKHQNIALLASVLSIIFLVVTPLLIGHRGDNGKINISALISPFLLFLPFAILSRKYGKKAKTLICNDAKRAQKYHLDLKQTRIIVCISIFSIFMLVLAENHYHWSNSIFLFSSLLIALLSAVIGFLIRKRIKNQQLGLGN